MAPRLIDATFRSVRLLRVILVDGSTLVRERLAQSFREFADVCVTGQYDDAGAALSELSRQQTDLVVLDGPLRVGNGMQVLGFVSAALPGTLAFVFSEDDGVRARARWAGAGADAFFSKASEWDLLLDAVIRLSEESRSS